MNIGDKIPAGLKGKLITPSEKELGKDAGKSVALSSLWKEGPLVLYFYPKDNTPGCTTEALQFRDHLKKFAKFNARVVGVSRDDAKAHCSFISKQDLNFDLLSDTDGSITEAFGVWVEKSMYGKKYMGIARQTFLIEKGKIVKKKKKVAVKTHAEDVLKVLAGS